jgi:hypothetical protein
MSRQKLSLPKEKEVLQNVTKCEPLTVNLEWLNFVSFVDCFSLSNFSPLR